MSVIMNRDDVAYSVISGSIAERVMPAGQWLPISTFDRDQTPHNSLVICAHRALRFVEVLRWRKHTEWFDGHELRQHEGWCFCLPSGQPADEFSEPTHWMITPELS